MASIIFTGITSRVVNNWLPAFRLLAARGNMVRTILFPHLADPDSADLARLEFENLKSIPIPVHLSQAQRILSRDLAGAAVETIRLAKPDLLVLTACHAGPEAELMELLAAERERPTIIGCQHGFAQNWDGYWERLCVDYLAVFGTHFLKSVPPAFLGRVVATSLPKLDLIHSEPSMPFGNDPRPILFAAQTVNTPELRTLLIDLSRHAQRKLVLRPHPEFRSSFAELEEHLDFWSVEVPIQEQMRMVSLLLTTGSTAALEAIAAGVPVAVLPEQRGVTYGNAGIVASRMDPAEVLDIAARQSEPQQQSRLREFLIAATGSDTPNRANKAADCFQALIGRKTSTVCSSQ